MESIKLATRLGNCNLKVSAQLQDNDKAKKLLGEYAMQFLIWHALGSEAFNKKSDYQRDAEYSDGLAAHLKSKGLEILNEVFEGVLIETSKRVTIAPIDKLIKEFVGLGLSQDDAKAQAEAVLAKLQQKTETKVEAKDEEIV